MAVWLRAAELCTFLQKAEMFPDFQNIPPSTDLDAFLPIKDLISLYAAVRIGINFGWQLKMAANQSSRRTDMELHKLWLDVTVLEKWNQDWLKISTHESL